MCGDRYLSPSVAVRIDGVVGGWTSWVPHLGVSMRILGRFFFPALAGVLAAFVLAPLSCAESLNITRAPAGANVEIDGALVGTTPFHTDYPGGFFHKTHTVFGSRLKHAMTLRVSKDGYAAQQITITDGPYEWLSVNGKRHGNYFVLKSDHFDMKLTRERKSRARRGLGMRGSGRCMRMRRL
jgi:hypothetical protein